MEARSGIDELENVQKYAAMFVPRNYTFEEGSMTGILAELKWEKGKARIPTDDLIPKISLLGWENAGIYQTKKKYFKAKIESENKDSKSLWQSLRDGYAIKESQNITKHFNRVLTCMLLICDTEINQSYIPKIVKKNQMKNRCMLHGCLIVMGIFPNIMSETSNSDSDSELMQSEPKPLPQNQSEK